MSVGNQASSATIDTAITTYALGLRNLLQQVRDLNTFINGQGTGTATLQALGYSAADAATAETLIGYLNNLAGVYFGTATVGTAFNFDNALAPVWAARQS